VRSLSGFSAGAAESCEPEAFGGCILWMTRVLIEILVVLLHLCNALKERMLCPTPECSALSLSCAFKSRRKASE